MKKLVSILLTVSFVLLVFSMGSIAADYTFKIGHVHQTTTAPHQALLAFSEYVAQNTDGNVKIEIYPDGALGTGIQVIERTMTGTIDGSLGYSGGLYPYEKSIGVFSSYFLWDDYETMLEVWRGEVGQQVNEGLAESGFRVLGPICYAGERYLTTRETPIYSPEDLKGLKTRCVEDKIALAFTEAMGAIPTPIAFSELYMALQQKIVNGQVNGLSQIWNQKFFEQQKYLMLTNLKFTDFVLVVNENKFQSLPDEYQKVMIDGAYNVWAEGVRENALKEEKELIVKLQREGMIMTIPDRDAFKVLAHKKAYQLEEEGVWPKGLFDQVLAQIEEIKSK